jgi:hypothetical protein
MVQEVAAQAIESSTAGVVMSRVAIVAGLVIGGYLVYRWAIDKNDKVDVRFRRQIISDSADWMSSKLGLSRERIAEELDRGLAGDRVPVAGPLSRLLAIEYEITMTGANRYLRKLAITLARDDTCGADAGATNGVIERQLTWDELPTRIRTAFFDNGSIPQNYRIYFKASAT